MHKFLWLNFIFSVDALQVSDYTGPPTGVTFYKLYVAFGICQYVCLLCGYSHTTDRRMVPAYTKYDIQLIKVAPDDGLV
jgi:hypothetical protein